MPAKSARRRATTVTSGGSSTDSSPGDTSVIASRYSATGPGPAQAGASAQASTSSSPASTAKAGSRAPDVGMAGVGHRQRAPADTPGARHRLLGHDPAARADRGPHAAQDGNRRMHVQEHEAAERQIEGLGQGQLLGRLGQRHHLGLGRRRGRGGHLVAPGRVQVDRVDPAVAADHAGQGHGDVTAAGTRRRRTSNPPAGRAGPGPSPKGDDRRRCAVRARSRR